MKKGLILEGGALRALFTAGVIDVMMENGITFDGLVGVSAGGGLRLQLQEPPAGPRHQIQQAVCP